MRRVKPFLSLPVLCAALLLTGCPDRPGSAAREAVGTNLPAPEGRAIRGSVVELLPDRGSILLDHDEMPGFMPRMTMEFKVTPADLAALQPGQRIAARMIEEPDGLRLEGIWPEMLTADPALRAAAQALRQDTITRGSGAYREVGEVAPSFALVNQDGHVVHFSQLRGRKVVVNFIFTRCNVATMCPASTAKMVRLQREAKEAGVKDLHLLSISLDPAFDSPAVLREYAISRGIDLVNFSLLTGPPEAVADLLRQFGILVAPGDNIIKHTLATLLIGPGGRIVHREDGSAWQPESFLEVMRRLDAAGPSRP